MKKLFSFLMLAVLVMPAFAISSEGIQAGDNIVSDIGLMLKLGFKL